MYFAYYLAVGVLGFCEGGGIREIFVLDLVWVHYLYASSCQKHYCCDRCLFYLLSLFLQFVTTQSFFPPAAAMGHKQQSGGREPGFYIRPVCTAQGI